MTHVLRLVLMLGLAAGLAGCQISRPGGGETVTPNAVTGGEIEVTALDEAPAPVATGEGESAPEAAAQAEAATAVEVPTEATAAEAAVEPVAETIPTPEAVADTPGVAKTEAQLACEKKRGRWVAVGSGELRTCVFSTRDAGKECRRESECEGACLARSGTCAPFRPLIGCHEVLQDNGMRATQCIQ